MYLLFFVVVLWWVLGMVVLWWVLGMAGFSYFWTRDSYFWTRDFGTRNFPSFLCFCAGLLGPVTWLAGLVIHRDRRK